MTTSLFSVKQKKTARCVRVWLEERMWNKTWAVCWGLKFTHRKWSESLGYCPLNQLRGIWPQPVVENHQTNFICAGWPSRFTSNLVWLPVKRKHHRRRQLWYLQWGCKGCFWPGCNSTRLLALFNRWMKLQLFLLFVRNSPQKWETMCAHVFVGFFVFLKHHATWR